MSFLRTRFRIRLAMAASLVMSAVTVAACNGSLVDPPRGNTIAAQDSAAQFKTNASSYAFTTTSIATEGSITATLTNRTGRTMYFVNCAGATGVSVQRLDGVRWTEFYAPVRNLCLSAPITVPNGGSHTFDIRVFAGKAGNNYYPKFESPLMTAVYRVMWHDAYFSYQDRLPWGEPVPESQRVSNSFVIRAP
ncbi:MAG TPA: hypothetical protein VE869_18390 [Gemmatimonas sp.]|nr:hypothetical protein [Gemmatimonas sp.]